MKSELEPEVVYILGSTRSGTSALRNALCTTRYKGNGEGHFIGLIYAFRKVLADFYASHKQAIDTGSLLTHVPEDAVRDSLFAIGRRAYTDSWPGGYILDKTPNIEPIRAIGMIETMWPKIHFLFCARRGIDNVLSKQRKWPAAQFPNLCREWQEIILEWERRKSAIKSPWLEVDFFDLEQDPKGTSVKIAELLRLNAVESESIFQYLMENRPERTGEKPGTCTRLLDTPWSDEQRQVFIRTCGDAMRLRGYGWDAYWAKDEAHERLIPDERIQEPVQ
jgi:hypothetical protein